MNILIYNDIDKNNKKFIIPLRKNYTFHDLLIDSCKFFDKENPNNYIFHDSRGEIIPIEPPIPIRKFLRKFSHRGNY